MNDPRDDRDTFARSAEESGPGFIGELLAYMLENKKWWLTPIIVALLLLSVLILLTSSAAAPFIYTLF